MGEHTIVDVDDKEETTQVKIKPEPMVVADAKNGGFDDGDGEDKDSAYDDNGNEEGSGVDWGSMLGYSAENTLPPAEIKEMGNEAYKAGDYEKALTMWKACLKNLLKESVRSPSKEGWDMQLACRLNMAMAFLKQKEFRKVVIQTDAVLTHQPENPKALFRKATALYELQELDEAEAVLSKLLEVSTDNKDGYALKVKIDKARAQYTNSAKKVFGKMFKPRPEDPDANPNKEVVFTGQASDYIKWLDDDSDKAIWQKVFTVQDESHKSKPFLHTLPLTLVHALDRVATMDPEHVKSILPKDRLVIHVLGARGEFEMEAQWSELFWRMPHVKELIVVAVGFSDAEDPWARTLPDDSLSPPMVSRLSETGQKVVMRLYRGMYHHFLSKYTSEYLDFNKLQPDVVYLPNAGLTCYVDSWTQTLCDIAERNYLCVVTGYSGSEKLTHDANDMQPIIEEIGMKVLVPTERNPFPINLKPASDQGIKTWQGYGKPCGYYYGPTAKNAVLLVCKGMAVKPSELPHTPAKVKALKVRLMQRNVEIKVDTPELVKALEELTMNSDN